MPYIAADGKRFIFILISFQSGFFFWKLGTQCCPGLTTARIPDKGEGVIVTAHNGIPANTRLPFRGCILNEAEYQNLVAEQAKDKDNRYKLMDYIVRTGKEAYLDAHPRRGYPAMAALVNEPSKGETSNVRLLITKTGCFLVAVGMISKGDELLYCYGSGFKRHYAIGKMANKPRWW